LSGTLDAALSNGYRTRNATVNGTSVRLSDSRDVHGSGCTKARKSRTTRTTVYVINATRRTYVTLYGAPVTSRNVRTILARSIAAPRRVTVGKIWTLTARQLHVVERRTVTLLCGVQSSCGVAYRLNVATCPTANYCAYYDVTVIGSYRNWSEDHGETLDRCDRERCCFKTSEQCAGIMCHAHDILKRPCA